MQEAVDRAYRVVLEGGTPHAAAAAIRRYCKDFASTWAIYRRWQQHVRRGFADLPLHELLEDVPSAQTWEQGLAWLAKQRGGAGANAVALMRALRGRVRPDPTAAQALTAMMLARDVDVRDAAVGLGKAWAEVAPDAAQRMCMDLLHGHRLAGVHASAAWIGHVAPRPQDALHPFFERLPGVGVRARHRLVTRLLPASRAGSALAPTLARLHQESPFSMHTFLAWLAERWRHVFGLEEVCGEILAADPAAPLTRILQDALDDHALDTRPLRRLLQDARPDAAHAALTALLDEIDDDETDDLPAWPPVRRTTLWRLRRRVRQDAHAAWEGVRTAIAAEPALERRLALAAAWQAVYPSVPAPPPGPATRARARQAEGAVMPFLMWGAVPLHEVQGDAPWDVMLDHVVSGLLMAPPVPALARSWLAAAAHHDLEGLQRRIVRAARRVDPATAEELILSEHNVWRRGPITWAPIRFAGPTGLARWLRQTDAILPALGARVRAKLLRADQALWEHLVEDVGFASLSAAELEAEVMRHAACMQRWPARAAARQSHRLLDNDHLPPGLRARIPLRDDLLSRVVGAIRDRRDLQPLAAEAREAGDDEALSLLLPEMVREDPALLREAFDVLARRVQQGHRVGRSIVDVGRAYIATLPEAQASRRFAELHRLASQRSSGAYPVWFYAVLTWKVHSVDPGVVAAARRELGMDR